VGVEAEVQRRSWRANEAEHGEEELADAKLGIASKGRMTDAGRGTSISCASDH